MHQGESIGGSGGSNHEQEVVSPELPAQTPNLHQNVDLILEQVKNLKRKISTEEAKRNHAGLQIEGMALQVDQLIDKKTAQLKAHIEGMLGNFKVSLKNSIREQIFHKEAESSENNKKRRMKQLFAEKTFMERESLLTQLSKKDDFRTIQNMLVSMAFVLMFYIITEEFYETGNIIDFSIITFAFSKINVVIETWLILTGICFSVVPLIQLVKLFNLTKYFFIPAAVVGHFSLYFVAVFSCFYYSLPPASAIIVTCECVRLSMKFHAYMRDKLLFGRPENEGARFYAHFIPERSKKAGATIDDLKLPVIAIDDIFTEFGRFAYFFICPSLVYRDKFLRSHHIRFSYVFNNLIGMLFSVTLTFVVLRVLSIPKFREFQDRKLTLRLFLGNTFLQSVTGTLILVMGFFGILHSWLSLMAQLTRYADRRFYQDWWNVEGFQDYYRKWNIVVHEFLYYYVYKDCMRFSNGKLRNQGSTYIVFLVSVIFHEVVATCMMGFFFPVLAFLFGCPGVLFTKMNRSTGQFNLAFWIFLLLGNGILMVLVSWEWYARNSPSYDLTLMKDGLWAVLMPASFSGR